MSDVAVGGTAQVNIRFDQRTRDALEELAALSDRPISRVVRYAVEAWAGDPERTYPVLGRSLSETVNMRMDTVLLARVDAICVEAGLTRSTGIRCAVQAWLSSTTDEQRRAALGGPAVNGGA